MTEEIMFVESMLSQDRYRVRKANKVLDDTVSLRVNVHDILTSAKECGHRDIQDCVGSVKTLEVEYDTCDLLTKTVEGQHILEWFAGEFLGKPLDLRTPSTKKARSDMDYVWCKYLIEYPDDGNLDVGKWRVGPFADFEFFDGDVVSIVHEHIEEVSENYTYVLRWVNEDREEYYYVGESGNIVRRLQQHISSDGNFSAAKQSDNNHLLDVEEVVPSTEATEAEKYDELVSLFGEHRVFGGR